MFKVLNEQNKPLDYLSSGVIRTRSVNRLAGMIVNAIGSETWRQGNQFPRTEFFRWLQAMGRANGYQIFYSEKPPEQWLAEYRNGLPHSPNCDMMRK